MSYGVYFIVNEQDACIVNLIVNKILTQPVVAKETIKFLFAAGLLKIIVFNIEHSRSIYITISVYINADDGIPLLAKS